MSLAITGYALAVSSAALLTIGTGMQALANFGEYRSLKKTVGTKMAAMYQGKTKPGETCPVPVAVNTSVSLFAVIWVDLVLLFRAALAVGKIREGGGKDAAEAARFLRAAEVWAILAIGSVLALAAAVIQLRLAVKS